MAPGPAMGGVAPRPGSTQPGFNARARTNIEAGTRDSMRRIDDRVLERLGNSNVLPLVRSQRELEEDLAGMRHRVRLRRIAADFGPGGYWPGRPLGRALEGSAIELWLLERKGQLARDLEALGTRIEAQSAGPELESLRPREPRIPE